MNKYFTNTSVGYICIAAVLIAFTMAPSGKRVSDEAVKAQAEACAKIGMKPYVRLTSSELVLNCEKP